MVQCFQRPWRCTYGVQRPHHTMGQVVGVGGGTPSSTGHWLHPHLQIIGGARCKNNRAEGWGSCWGEGEDQLHGGESGRCQASCDCFRRESQHLFFFFVSPVTRAWNTCSTWSAKTWSPSTICCWRCWMPTRFAATSLRSQGLSATWRRTVRAKRAPRNPRLSDTQPRAVVRLQRRSEAEVWTPARTVSPVRRGRASLAFCYVVLPVAPRCHPSPTSPSPGSQGAKASTLVIRGQSLSTRFMSGLASWGLIVVTPLLPISLPLFGKYRRDFGVTGGNWLGRAVRGERGENVGHAQKGTNLFCAT